MKTKQRLLRQIITASLVLLCFVLQTAIARAEGKLKGFIDELENTLNTYEQLKTVDKNFRGFLDFARSEMQSVIGSEMAKWDYAEKGDALIHSEGFSHAKVMFENHLKRGGQKKTFVKIYYAMVLKTLSGGNPNASDLKALEYVRNQAMRATGGKEGFGDVAKFETEYPALVKKGHELYREYLLAPNDPEKIWTLANYYRRPLRWFAHERAALKKYLDLCKGRNDKRVVSGECDFRILRSYHDNYEFKKITSSGWTFIKSTFPTSQYTLTGEVYWLMQDCLKHAKEAEYQGDRWRILSEMEKKCPGAEAFKNGDFYWDFGHTYRRRAGDNNKKLFREAGIQFNTLRKKYKEHRHVKSGEAAYQEAEAFRMAGKWEEALGGLRAIPGHHWTKKQKDQPWVARFHWYIKMRWSGFFNDKKAPRMPKK